MSMQKLCSGDWDRTLQFTVFDWNRSTSLFQCTIQIVYIDRYVDRQIDR